MKIEYIKVNYSPISIEMTDGTKFNVRSAMKKDFIKLDLDPLVHTAWTKKVSLKNSLANEVSKFNIRFKSLNLY